MCQGTDEFQLLKWYQAGIVGQWEGVVQTPWTDPYGVTFRFDADGHYADHSQSSVHSALYYGQDGDSPEKVYELDDVQASKKAVGTIAIVFGLDSTNQGDIKKLWLSADLKQLQFEVWKQEYGPLKYELQRVTQP